MKVNEDKEQPSEWLEFEEWERQFTMPTLDDDYEIQWYERKDVIRWRAFFSLN